MICVVIKGPSFDEAHAQLAKALTYADLVELRLDYFTSCDDEALKKLRAMSPLPMIFALRSTLHGGNYALAEEQRLDEIRRLALLEPEYLDLENHIAPSFIQEITSQYP